MNNFDMFFEELVMNIINIQFCVGPTIVPGDSHVKKCD